MCSHIVTPGVRGGWTQLNTSVQHQDVREGEVALSGVLYRVTIVTTGLMMELFNQRISPSMSLSAWTNENYQKNVPLWPQWRSTRRAREKPVQNSQFSLAMYWVSDRSWYYQTVLFTTFHLDIPSNHFISKDPAPGSSVNKITYLLKAFSPLLVQAKLTKLILLSEAFKPRCSINCGYYKYSPITGSILVTWKVKQFNLNFLFKLGSFNWSLLTEILAWYQNYFRQHLGNRDISYKLEYKTQC